MPVMMLLASVSDSAKQYSVAEGRQTRLGWTRSQAAGWLGARVSICVRRLPGPVSSRVERLDTGPGIWSPVARSAARRATWSGMRCSMKPLCMVGASSCVMSCNVIAKPMLYPISAAFQLSEKYIWYNNENNNNNNKLWYFTKHCISE